MYYLTFTYVLNRPFLVICDRKTMRTRTRKKKKSMSIFFWSFYSTSQLCFSFYFESISLIIWPIFCSSTIYSIFCSSSYYSAFYYSPFYYSISLFSFFLGKYSKSRFQISVTISAGPLQSIFKDLSFLSSCFSISQPSKSSTLELQVSPLSRFVSMIFLFDFEVD